MNHFFLDTNIVIDVLANRKPFSGEATKLLDYGEKGMVNLYISSLSYSNIYYILRKITSHKELLSLLRDVEAIMTTIDVTASVVRESINTELKDFEDALQLNTALSDGRIQAIVTRDPHDFKTKEISIITPKEALSMIENAGS
jgi:predicted nucleic acid-binding protein